MKRRKLFTILFAWMMILTIAFPGMVQADVLTNMTKYKNWPTAPSIESKSAILIDARTGSILYQKKANKASYPASITKVMTALIVLERCELDEEVTFSYRATHDLEPGSTTIARTEGEIMTVEQCLHALLLQSANEVAQALAEHVAGSIEDFAVLMNEKAAELGCTNTHFNNPSGLNSTEHYTTCHDMALILQAACKDPDFLEIESHLTYTIPATNKHEEETPIAQKHGLLKNGSDHYEGALAGKTGYTTIAGHTLVTYAKRGDMELVCVIMRCEGTHYADTRALLDYGFDSFSMRNLSDTTAKTAVRRAWEDQLAVQESMGIEAEAVTESAEESTDAEAAEVGMAGIAGLAQDSVSEEETSDTIPVLTKLSDSQWENAYFSEDSWILLPETLDFSSLTSEVTFLANGAAEGEDIALATIQYMNKDEVLGSGTLYLPADLAAETEAETEAESETEPAAKPLSKQNIKSVLIDIGGFLVGLYERFLGFLQELDARYGWKLWLGMVVGSILVILLLIGFWIFRNGLNRKKKYYGPHFTSRPRRRHGKNENKYHMKDDLK